MSTAIRATIIALTTVALVSGCPTPLPAQTGVVHLVCHALDSSAAYVLPTPHGNEGRHEQVPLPPDTSLAIDYTARQVEWSGKPLEVTFYDKARIEAHWSYDGPEFQQTVIYIDRHTGTAAVSEGDSVHQGCLPRMLPDKSCYSTIVTTTTYQCHTADK